MDGKQITECDNCRVQNLHKCLCNNKYLQEDYALKKLCKPINHNESNFSFNHENTHDQALISGVNNSPFSIDFENMWNIHSVIQSQISKESQKEFIPEFCDGPKSTGNSRLLYNKDSSLFNCAYDNLFESEDIGMEMCNNWVNLDNLFERQNNVKQCMPALSFKSNNETKSSHFNFRSEKKSKIKIIECPKSNELSGDVRNKFKNDDKEQNCIHKKSANSYKGQDFSFVEGSLNTYERQPSQSSKTVTQSYTEGFDSNLNNSNSKKDKARLKRGTTTQYLIENTPEEIVYNTLTGLVIKFIRENGPQPFDTLLKLVTAKYHTLRKLSGQFYTGDTYKALRGTLTSNGLFQEIKNNPMLYGNTEVNLNKKKEQDKFKFDSNKSIYSNWNIIESSVQEYLNDKISMIVEKRRSLISKSKFKIKGDESLEQERIDSISQNKFSLKKSSIESKREMSVSNKSEIYNKINSFINQLSPDEEEKFIEKKSSTVKMLSRHLDKYNKSTSLPSTEDIPEQLLGALQLYAFFRDSKDSNSLKSLSENLNKLSQCINKLNSNI